MIYPYTRHARGTARLHWNSVNLQNRHLGDHTHAPTCKLIGGASAGPTLPLVQHAARTSRATIACVQCMLACGQHGPARQFAACTAPLRRAVGAASTPHLEPPQPPHASRAPPQHRRTRYCPRRPSPRAPKRRQPSETAAAAFAPPLRRRRGSCHLRRPNVQQACAREPSGSG